MRIETLKSPGVNSQGLQLRTIMARAISHAELYSSATDKQALTDFCYDAAVKSGGNPLGAIPTSVIVTNGSNIPVQNSAGAAIDNAVATVAGGVLTAAKLPATDAVVKNSIKINIGAGSGSGNFATFTVVAGVITAVVLSAS